MGVQTVYILAFSLQPTYGHIGENASGAGRTAGDWRGLFRFPAVLDRRGGALRLLRRLGQGRKDGLPTRSRVGACPCPVRTIRSCTKEARRTRACEDRSGFGRRVGSMLLVPPREEETDRCARVRAPARAFPLRQARRRCCPWNRNSMPETPGIRPPFGGRECRACRT